MSKFFIWYGAIMFVAMVCVCIAFFPQAIGCLLQGSVAGWLAGLGVGTYKARQELPDTKEQP